MGNFFSDKKNPENKDSNNINQDNINTSNGNNNIENHLPLNESLKKSISNKSSKENKTILLSYNNCLNKNNNLGKKRERPKNKFNSQNMININEINEKKINKEDIIEKNIDENKKKENIIIKNNINFDKEKNGKFKNVEVDSNVKVEYIKMTSLPFHHELKNNNITKVNEIYFNINQAYENKLEKEEEKAKEKEKEKLEKMNIDNWTLLNSFISSKSEINNNMNKEEMNKNSINKSKKIIENTFMINQQNSQDEKIKNKTENNEESEDNKMEELYIKSKELYEYECIPENPYVKGTKGVKQLSIDIKIKNNGISDWPKENIFLITNKKYSQINAEEIKIIPLKSGWVSTERIIFKYTDNLSPGIYYSYINLNINGINYGKPIKIKIEIIQNENKNDNKIFNSIKKMREIYSLSENEISDDKIKEVLIKSNYDFAKGFEYLFSDN